MSYNENDGWNESKEKENNVEFKYSINNVIPKELHGDSARLKQIICSILIFQ